MEVRAICQVMSGTNYALAIWNPDTRKWEIDAQTQREAFPDVPPMGDGWVFQYRSDKAWKSHGVVFDPFEAPRAELFEECA